MQRRRFRFRLLVRVNPKGARINVHLNPHSHSCAEHPNLACPACKWAEEQQAVDVLVHNEGTVWLFNPISERASEWVGEHVLTEPWQWLGQQFAVEHRYAPAIVEAMRGDGLVLQ
jgi:hypothetical protein